MVGRPAGVQAESGKTTDEQNASRGSMATAGLLAGAVVTLALPSAVLAISTGFDPIVSAPVGQAIDAGPSPEVRLAGPMPIRSLAKGSLYPFTPARPTNRPDRSVTVAVRVDPVTANAILVRGARTPRLAEAVLPLRLAPSAFNLGVSRGYHNFSQDLVPPADSRRSEVPDLQAFSLAPATTGNGANPRFSPRIVMDEKQASGRAPRTFAGDGEGQVDVGGSYRLTRNLNVTAGVRYSAQERERLQPLTDGKQDGQAVYLGTQFRF